MGDSCVVKLTDAAVTAAACSGGGRDGGSDVPLAFGRMGTAEWGIMITLSGALCLKARQILLNHAA